MTESNRLRYISSIFSKASLHSLMLGGGEGVSQVQNMAYETGITTHLDDLKVGEIYDLAYKELLNSYRNEYVYKHAIAENIIRGKHRLSPKCHFDTEFRVYDSIADVVIANGTTTVYEIKTEYDSFDRLENQINDYAKVFEYIYIVVPESKLLNVLSKIPEFVGVMTLTDGYTLRTEKKAISNINNIEPSVVFSCLRREEFINIIKQNFNELPFVRPVELKAECKKLFLTLPKVKAHKAFLNALKSRSLQSGGIKMIEKGPSSLTSIFLTAKLSTKQVGCLVKVLGGGNKH